MIYFVGRIKVQTSENVVLRATFGPKKDAVGN
jgi:hypothetical protein